MKNKQPGRNMVRQKVIQVLKMNIQNEPADQVKKQAEVGALRRKATRDAMVTPG